MKRIVLHGNEGKDRVMAGMDLIANSVSVTLGGNGRNCMIIDFFEKDYRQHWYPPHNTKDGVTVAMNIVADEAFEQAGVMLMQEASAKTMEQAGDGTTTTIVIARELCRVGLKMVKEGYNPVVLKKELEKAVTKVIKDLEAIAIPVGDNHDKIREIATVSANNDPVIGKLIGDAFQQIGKEGIIDIAEGKGVETEILVSEGYKFDGGFVNPLFMNIPGKQRCELKDPLILVYDNQIEFMKNIDPVLAHATKNSRPILIICSDMTGEALAFIINNVLKGNIKCCVVKSPQIRGMNKEEALKDIAIACNAQVIGNIKGVPLEKTSIHELGKAEKVIITRESTSIIGATKRADYQETLDNLRMDLAQQKDEAEKEKISKRIASLQGGVATISVGGYTETEMKEKKDRVDDAIRATKAAIEEGYVVGGGITFLELMRGKTWDKFDGEALLYTTLMKPLAQICYNSGVSNGDVLEKIGMIKDEDEFKRTGYNTKTDRVEDLLAAGIIDPAKVIRCCIQNAASVAGQFLITDCFIGGAY